MFCDNCKKLMETKIEYVPFQFKIGSNPLNEEAFNKAMEIELRKARKSMWKRLLEDV